MFDKTKSTIITYPGGKSGEYTIPNSVNTIGGNAFRSCEGLTSVIISDSVTTIGEDAFGECTGLTSVTIPDFVSFIGDCAFGGCYGLTSVSIGHSVTTIGDQAFYGCNITSITIPNSVITIGAEAFSYCYGLTTVTIPDSVTSIGDGAFMSCIGLTSVTIGSSVSAIGYCAFANCEKISKVFVYAVEPPTPTASENTIYDDTSYIRVFSSATYDSAVLAVPAKSLELYKSAADWKDFTHITAVSESAAGTGVEGVVNDNTIEVCRYNTSGQRVSEDYKGIVVIRYNDGSVKKQIAK